MWKGRTFVEGLRERIQELGGHGAEGLASQGGQFGAQDGEEVGGGGSERLRGRIGSQEFIEVYGSQVMEGFEGEKQDFEFYLGQNWSPVQMREDGGDVGHA